MKQIKIGNRYIGNEHPCFIVAEISANHNQSFKKAKKLIYLAKKCGADAVKFQTYTADTITINSSNQYFTISDGPWKGQTLYELYKKAYTPWKWQKDLKRIADEIGILFFSTPFDKTAVDFLETLKVPAYKISSFELVDIPLIEYVASKKKPILLSTGMGSLSEINLAVKTMRSQGNNQIVLLKCTSEYPALPEDMNLRGIRFLLEKFKVPCGLSDHSLVREIPIAAVALGASVIEKHFIEKRSDGGPDAIFSLDAKELKKTVDAIRTTEKALGKKGLMQTRNEKKNIVFRKSLFVVKDIKNGGKITEKNVRSIRPGYGLPPRYLSSLIGKKVNCELKPGTPLQNKYVLIKKK